METICMKCQIPFSVKLVIYWICPESGSLETSKRVIGKQCRPRSDAGDQCIGLKLFVCFSVLLERGDWWIKLTPRRLNDSKYLSFYTMTDQSQLGSSDLEEDYPCIVGLTRSISDAYTPQHQLCTGREGYSVQSRFINSGIGSREDVAPQPHPYEGYKVEHKRLETFNDWPNNGPVNKIDLARNGFIYLHIGDRVQCVFCRGILSSWEQGDVIEDEHRKHCPECPFAFGYACGNVPISETRNEQVNTVRQPASQHLPTHFSYPQTQTAGNFVKNPFQPNPRSAEQANPSDQSVPRVTVHLTPVQQVPQPVRKIAVQVRPESNSDISYNRQSGSLNIYSGNVTLTAGNQEDAIGSLPSLPVSSKPSVQSANRESVITSPKYPKWENEMIRLKSFSGWPAQMTQKPKDLARAGLLYMGKRF